MKSLFIWLGKSMEETPGEPSSTRLTLFLVTLAAVIAPLVVWSFVSWHQRAMAEVPQSVIEFCGILFGAAGTAKIIQKGKEQ